ncbi:hypothetical protein PYCCODRAFT_1429809 [Trametes coccinea BRFM310]|uniref:Uncharacterized protein n=1 Tax=Trametes coccinea (strain BRFM310) TaxID=1353009 RepID=A0A1Y2J8D9_TRAC3|nr:hypothetical protein PYCCODRAFT_1429809 [Trametes coccinea BRFM310]
MLHIPPSPSPPSAHSHSSTPLLALYITHSRMCPTDTSLRLTTPTRPLSPLLPPPSPTSPHPLAHASKSSLCSAPVHRSLSAAPPPCLSC